MDMRGQGLTSLPVIWYNATMLYLNYNNLTRVTLSQVLPALASVYLDYNLLTDLPDLSNATYLRILKLSHNLINHVDPDTLESMTLVYDLDLDYNLITALPDPITHPAMSTLHLSFNQLTQCPKLSGFPELMNVMLDFNNITTCDKEAFDGLIKLSTIYINDNPLNHIPDFTAIKDTLQTLYLTGLAQIESLPQELFVTYTALQFVCATAIGLTTFPDFIYWSPTFVYFHGPSNPYECSGLQLQWINAFRQYVVMFWFSLTYSFFI